MPSGRSFATRWPCPGTDVDLGNGWMGCQEGRVGYEPLSDDPYLFIAAQERPLPRAQTGEPVSSPTLALLAMQAPPVKKFGGDSQNSEPLPSMLPFPIFTLATCEKPTRPIQLTVAHCLVNSHLLHRVPATTPDRSSQYA
ncbi:hypothetical protein QC761_0034500 [Podospora bellae-mahoneyi]|uniref:Uncharacterized protein n=1 Tax=Podospora bellae-mahoneyi TaxID=2093777 RepID=A0ABR0FR76_9PEZI|nr:hypothetical protein QC761_0034500 [Podospora bellae-mahoneyi]